jgi:hypothetical protein
MPVKHTRASPASSIKPRPNLIKRASQEFSYDAKQAIRARASTIHPEASLTFLRGRHADHNDTLEQILKNRLGFLISALLLSAAMYAALQIYDPTTFSPEPDASGKEYVDSNLPVIFSSWSPDEYRKHASSEANAAISQQDLDNLFSGFSCIGKFKSYVGSKEVSNGSYRDGLKNVVTAEYESEIDFENGRAKITTYLVKKDKKWEMSGFYFLDTSALQQLRSGEIDKVENRFSDFQKKFETGEVTEYQLLDKYKAFYQREDLYRIEMDNWIKFYPNSESARLARGVYFRKLGELTRGTAYAPKVPQEKIDYMNNMFSLAKRDLEAVLEKNPKSYLAILNLLNIAQFESDKTATAKYLSLGNEVLPSNFIVRARYLIQLAPKWRGSHEKMASFIERCRAEGVPQDKIDLFNAIRANDMGTMLEEKGDTDNAQVEYKNALVFARNADYRFRQDYLANSSRICLKQEHKDKDYCP